MLGWSKNDLDKGLARSADEVAAEHGPAAKQFVIDAENALDGDASKLFKVATDVIALAAKDGWRVPFLVVVIVAKRTYAQVKVDALTEVNGFLASLKALAD